MRARPEESLLLNPFARIRTFWGAQSGPRRALLALALALAFGLIVLPWLIYVAGALVLGPYAHGNALHFISDFFSALAHGELTFWLIVLGPVAFVLLLRLIWLALSRGAG